MQSIAEWLEELGLGGYAQRFAANGIDFFVLGHLSDQDLKDLGVLLGHRRKLQAAIAGLPGAAPAPPRTAAAPTTKPDEAAERRQLTVMFCDMVGSTALAARLDPEDMGDLIRGFRAAVKNSIARYNGYVAKWMGDGALVYFGYPVAHEDDAERALHAGLALVASVASLRQDIRLEARVGVATGLVVVGELVGEGEAAGRAGSGRSSARIPMPRLDPQRHG